jgi:hypothetical protein
MSFRFAWIVLALAGSASAQSRWHVDAGAVGPGSGSLADPFLSIQFAIEQPATADGDIIAVHPGLYRENVSYAGKELRIESTGGAAATTIAPAAGGSVVTITGGQTPVD